MCVILKGGDYVLATKYSGGGSQDPWAVGFYKSFDGDRHYIVDINGMCMRQGGFRRVKKITARRGAFFLNNLKRIEAGDTALWGWLRRPMKPKGDVTCA